MGNYQKHQNLVAKAKGIMGDIAKPELQALLGKLYGNPPSEKSLREDAAEAYTILDAIQIWWARQVKLTLDSSPTKSPTPAVVRVLETGYEEDVILRDWGGLLHRAKAILTKDDLVHFAMWDYFARKWELRTTRHAILEKTENYIRIKPSEQKWIKQKASKDAWSLDCKFRLVPHLRGKPLYCDDE